jgi:tripartite ATP-independent transporter DctM subunit
VPILTAAGYVLAVGGSSHRLVRLFRASVGFLPAGMALMVIAVCALFTTLTGGSGVTILALGGLVYPILRDDRYSENFSLGLVTASGSLGLLFFPSVPVILYAVVAQQPIEKLFIAGFIPGVLMILFVCGYAMVVGVREKVPRQPFHGRELLDAVLGAKWDLGVPAILLVTFVTGLATMVEASALALCYAVLVEVVIWRTLDWRRGLPKALVEAGTLVGAVLIVLGMAMGLTNYLVDEGIPQLILSWVRAHISSQVAFLLTLNALLLVLGSVLEIYSAIVVLAPLVVPLGVAYHVDPVHLGVIFLANLELGFLFPPVGLNLFLSSSRFGKPLPQLYRASWPFLCIMAVSVLAITYMPWMSSGVLHWWEGSP